jgi:hypothetical protein
VISNDVLREELARAKDLAAGGADRTARLEASTAQLEASLVAVKAALRQSKEEVAEVQAARDAAQHAEEEALAALDTERATHALRIQEILARADEALALQVKCQTSLPDQHG